ncbi:hypothetical protein AVEN_179977-1 [Araneus ventricosus]|uniref:Uncharacterized protein n=1 Tax=Araneus ventricosus TaxID=182803 RepID=A0A4Y2V1P1_ARAVE|nr:hypothetical protein AVEN_179977-1 [Araneus ventricosus]
MNNCGVYCYRWDIGVAVVRTGSRGVCLDTLRSLKIYLTFIAVLSRWRISDIGHELQNNFAAVTSFRQNPPLGIGVLEANSKLLDQRVRPDYIENSPCTLTLCMLNPYW